MQYLKRYLKKIGKSLIYNSERALIHAKYNSAPFFKKKLLRNPPGKEWLNSYIFFRKNGYAKIPSFIKNSEYDLFEKLKNKNILEMVEQGDLPLIKFGDSLNKVDSESGTLCQEIYSNSPLLKKDEYWQSFEWLVESYLGSKNFWIRNGPMIMSDHHEIKTNKHSVNYYHLDLGMRQLGFIVLLQPTDENSTCTQVIPKTHNSPRFEFEFYDERHTENFVRYAKNKEAKYGSVKLFGDIGSTFIFDAGNMLHKGAEGTNRLMFQINLTCSHTNKSGTSNLSSENILDAIGKKPSEAFK